ncbi:MAG: hypothetical protein ACI362_08770 [Coriobacteriales bacterium]
MRLERLPRVSRLSGLPSTAHELAQTPLDILPVSRSALHLLVPDERLRVKKHRHVYRVSTGGIVPNSFVQIRADICIASPELTLVQLSERLTLPQLARTIDELCGTYLPQRGYGGSFIDEVPSVTTLPRIARCAADHKGIFNTRTLQRALAYCAERSASPKETELQLLLNLPTICGGAQIPRFEMNVPLEIPPELRRYLNQSCVKPDLFRAQELLDIEYMSDQEHLGEQRERHDSRRRNVIEAMGIAVIDVWKEDLASAAAFERIIMQVKRYLGLRYRTPSPTTLARRQRTMEELREPLRIDDKPASV